MPGIYITKPKLCQLPAYDGHSSAIYDEASTKRDTGFVVGLRVEGRREMEWLLLACFLWAEPGFLLKRTMGY